jgi:Zn-dependent M28 family amino/carboxypeptidase
VSGLGDELARTVSGAGALTHLHALQRIADAHDGNRAAGTAGYAASVEYVTKVLGAAGYQVSTRDVPCTRFVATSERTWLDGVDPSPRTLLMDDSPPLTGARARLVVAFGIEEVAEVGQDLRGAVVLLARITGGYARQVSEASEAGALAVLFYTDTPTPANIDRLHWFGASPPPIPVASISQDDSARLAALAAGSRTLQVQLDWQGAGHSMISQNVLVAADGGGDTRVVVGAHLDSVLEAPGINDNGSGVAAVLQTAVALASAAGPAANRVTFALWAAEELVNVGSGYYVGRLTDAERQATALYLNAEMIGSPNYVPYVMHGAGTVTTPFDEYFQAREIGYEYIDAATIGSDHQSFRAAGIPVGGLHCGSVGIKTPAEQERYGGTAGQLYDPGYHQPADSIRNVSTAALDLTTRAMAYAVGWAAEEVRPA